eukprot:scaffold10881_cov130-Isochrysis_galbana.AAC.2
MSLARLRASSARPLAGHLGFTARVAPTCCLGGLGLGLGLGLGAWSLEQGRWLLSVALFLVSVLPSYVLGWATGTGTCYRCEHVSGLLDPVPGGTARRATVGRGTIYR